jgi:hypothetical protein
VVEELFHLMADRKQRAKKGLWTRDKLQRHNPIDLLPPTRPTSQSF